MLNFTGVAAEIFAASWCNLDCTYCNIPKHNKMIKDKHQEIIKDVIAVDPVINRLNKVCGKKLEVISHWGSEPTLTLPFFKDFYEKAVVFFPKLEKISMSSNFMTNPHVISHFVLEDLPNSKPLQINVQMSLDGEDWVTEVNRGEGTTETVQNNIVTFIESLNQQEDIVHKVKVHFKPTMSKDQYAKLLVDDNLFNHYQFFDNLAERMVNANCFNNVELQLNCDPTVVCPDKYTVADGKVLAEFYENVEILRKRKLFKHVVPSFGAYYGQFERMKNCADELFTKARMFTCSAGDSQFGISEYIHPCHDTFYLPYDEVQDAIRNDMGRINSSREAENLDTGRTFSARNALTKKLDGMTQHDADKYQYHMRSFHDFFKFRVSYSVAVIKAMVKCGQVSSCYTDNDLATMLAIFATVRHSCPTGNAQYTGSVHLTDIAYFRLFGNGLLEAFLRKGLSE